ncbi:MAG TPA: hypothetical protein VFK48_05065 [Usitatibacter sp.]|nr:hypothetical protein [Usitatibacter sp.]
MKSAQSVRAVLGTALLALCLGAAAAAPADALSDADRQCLACHGEGGAEKSFAAGAPVSLHVDAVSFARSVHASIGCAACHADVDLAKHPGGGKAYRSAREMAIAFSESCRGCHEASFDAHMQGVHGKAQAREGAGAPLCASCHGTHDIVRASLGTALRDSCLGCHAGASASHAEWLPNSKLHLDVVSCAACHAPGSGKRIELRFYDPAAKRELVTVADSGAAGNGAGGALDDRQLRAVVRAIDDATPGRVLLVGRLEPTTGAEGHRLLDKAHALKECATCHRKGAAPFQNVSLTIVRPDGERVRYEAQKDVLSGAGSLESVRGFYAMGGTRIHLLDVGLLLALAAGISAPLAHLLLRKWLRRKDSRHD